MTSAAREHFLARFAEHRAQLPGASLPWLYRRRSDAIDRFAELDLPTTRHEDWKYTSIAPIARRNFAIGVTDASPGSAAGDGVALHALDGTHRLVFVDGRFAAELSRCARLPAGVRVESLAQALSTRRGALEEHLGGADEVDANGFAALNAAFWADGAYIDIAPDVAVDRPIHLLFIATRADLASFLRNLVHVGAGASATVIEHYAGPDGIAYLTNAVTRVATGQGACVTHVKVQQEGGGGFHIADIGVEQAVDSRFASQSFAFGGQLARNEIVTRLDDRAAADLTGLYVGGGRQHHDHHTSIDHARPYGTSRQVYKGVLDDASRAVFNGRVIVRPDAQHTDAQQSNRNLLLSDGAEIDTKPQLEIWADDVKCAHGATVGQLDPDQLHYLRARGIDEAAARGLLTYAFAADVLRGIEHPALRARLAMLLPGRPPADLKELQCEILPTR